MFTLKINTNNDAFEHELEEIARILRVVAKQVEAVGDGLTAFDEQIEKPIRDINGNTVGKWELR